MRMQQSAYERGVTYHASHARDAEGNPLRFIAEWGNKGYNDPAGPSSVWSASPPSSLDDFEP